MSAAPCGLLDLPEHILRAIATLLTDDDRSAGIEQICRLQSNHTEDVKDWTDQTTHEACVGRPDIHASYHNHHLVFFWICRRLRDIVPPFGLKYVVILNRNVETQPWSSEVPITLRKAISHLTIIGKDTLDPPSDCSTNLYIDFIRHLTGLQTLMIHDVLDEERRMVSNKPAECAKHQDVTLNLPNLRSVTFEGTSLYCNRPLCAILAASCSSMESVRVLGHRRPNASCLTGELGELQQRYHVRSHDLQASDDFLPVPLLQALPPCRQLRSFGFQPSHWWELPRMVVDYDKQGKVVKSANTEKADVEVEAYLKILSGLPRLKRVSPCINLHLRAPEIWKRHCPPPNLEIEAAVSDYATKLRTVCPSLESGGLWVMLSDEEMMQHFWWEWWVEQTEDGQVIRAVQCRHMVIFEYDEYAYESESSEGDIDYGPFA